MNSTLRNIAAVIIGIIIGGMVNMGILMLMSSVIPPPEGVDVTNTESIKNSLHLFEMKHFLSPFLAHAGGTLIGVLLACIIAASHHMKIGRGIGIFFLLGGIASAFMIPAPTWFIVVDLVFAYLPMGYLGYKLSGK